MLTGSLSVMGVVLLAITLVTINNRFYDIKNLIDSVKACAGILFFLIPMLMAGQLNGESFAFLGDWRFYLLALGHSSSQVVIRHCFKVNERNMTLVQFLLTFSPLMATPLLVFYVGDLAGFSSTLKIGYQETYEVYLFSAVLIVLSLLFGIDKIKSNHVQGKRMLALMVVCASLLPALQVKMMQIYHPEALYMTMIVVNLMTYATIMVKHREWQHFKTGHLWVLTVPAILYIIYSKLNVIAAVTLPPEYLVMLRGAGSLLIAAAVDYALHKNWNLSRKDSLVAAAIMGSCFYMMAYR